MSRQEQRGTRDMTYSVWHRSLPWELSFLDIDWIERCDVCKRILCLYELAIDNGQDDKAGYATARLAKMAELKSYVVLYTPGPGHSITSFRVRQLTPEASAFAERTPGQWVEFLRRLRWCHPARATTPLPSDAWRGTFPETCATCGGAPNGRFADGSPRYDCSHPPVALDVGSREAGAA